MKKSVIIIGFLLIITLCGCTNSQKSIFDGSSSLTSDLNSITNTTTQSSLTSTSSNIVNNMPDALIQSYGWLESGVIEWKKVSNVRKYQVTYQLDNKEILVDDMLIKEYENYYRVDILGLKKGVYDVKVIALYNDGKSGFFTTQINVSNHLREGFAFVSGSSSGAYNDDGTLKENANVLYVTDTNKDSVTLSVQTSSGVNEFTGLQNILTAYKGRHEKKPLCVRLIGNITDLAVLEKGDLLIDDASNITIEGVGSDAVINGFGLRIKNSSNIEVRNLGFMNCDSNEGDSVGLQQSNDHIWVHNNDFYYGHSLSDADQIKGDGALDTKTSSYVTHSYNHFYDTGKSNLQGMKSEKETNYITYHHNWYDHSDSRHPRVRTCTVHVYNNYFDGNSKYGIGATMGSSIFSEANYFRNCKNPLLSSKQGTDALGEGTFSGENGGIIKSFNDFMTGSYKFISNKESNSFDAYIVNARDEQIPSTIKTVAGSTIYNNFDTDSNLMYKYQVETPENAVNSVKKYAGRANGGNLQWQFDNSVDDASYDVNQALKDALINYEGTIISVGTENISGYEKVIVMIDNINEKISLSDEEYLKNVHDKYLALSSSEQAKVTNYTTLQDALIKLSELKIKEAIRLIESIGTVTLDSKKVIDEANNYYLSLSESEKKLVINSNKLLEAIIEYEKLFGSIDFIEHDFSQSGLDSNYFTFISATLRNETATYGDITFTTALKMNSKASITFNTNGVKEISIYLKTRGDSTSVILIDDVKYDVVGGVEAQMIKITLSEGTHTIKYSKGETLIYRIVLA